MYGILMLIFQIFIAKGFEGDGSNKKTHSQKDTHLLNTDWVFRN